MASGKVYSTTDDVQNFSNAWNNENVADVQDIPGSSGKISLIVPKKTTDGFSKEVKLCQNTQYAINKFKTRLNYKVYHFMLPTLLIFLIVFITLIWKRSNNSIKMLELSDKVNIASNEFNKVSDEYNALYLDPNTNRIIVSDAEKIRDDKQLILDKVRKDYYLTIYIDNICDKCSDLCNGIIGAILMIYVGSAGYKMIKFNEKKNIEIPSCPIKKKTLLEQIFKK